MKAAFRSTYGSPDVLQIRETDKPIPGDNDVLIRVVAATVNRTDCGILWGKPFIIRFFTGLFTPALSITGTDFAGQIEAVGKNVTAFKVGDRVWGFQDNGLASHAQYMTLAADKAITTIPDQFTYEQAAASPEGAHYAYNFINKVDLKPGQRVLVNGATGAIGSAAVQLLKYFGAEVTAVCNTKNLALVKSLGADRVIDYMTEDFTKDRQQYHFVFDTVGKSSFGQCKPLLLPGGIYSSSELGPNWENIYLPLTTALAGQLPGRQGTKKVLFPIPSDIKRSLTLLNRLMEQKQFKPVIDRTYPLEDIAEAYRFVASGQKTGNVVIRM
ncbi:NAD(P)-dependent alcohol dehydrogenase [Nibrella viscosa]|uniref:NAD(P)-dependent alcohol dehydrogenase n=1 Tax=Nibrella viscosa TaxID=1084524 RepID=A0ABP8KUC3_9BACT